MQLVSTDHEVLPRSYDTQNCSVARAAEAVGDRWTMLVIRERSSASAGSTTSAPPGHRPQRARRPPHRLVDDGILDRRPYQDSPAPGSSPA